MKEPRGYVVRSTVYCHTPSVTLRPRILIVEILGSTGRYVGVEAEVGH